MVKYGRRGETGKNRQLKADYEEREHHQYLKKLNRKLNRFFSTRDELFLLNITESSENSRF